MANLPTANRSLVATLISVLTVGLMLVVAITLLPAVTGSAASVTLNRVGVQRDTDASVSAAERAADFDFADHELRYAGGYVLSPAAVGKGADFDFADHELRYAGGYALSPAATVGKGAEFDFVDHELRYAGGYSVRPNEFAKGGHYY